jgi:hypothetical protein
VAAQRQTNDGAPGRDGAGTRLKRRGLIAGAAAIAAGLALGRTAQPVAAVTGGNNGQALILGANNSTGNTPNTQTQPTMLVNAASYTYGASSETLVIITDKGAPALAIGSQKPGGGGQGIYSFSSSGTAIWGNVAQSGPSTGGTAVLAYSSDPQGYGVSANAGGAGATGVYSSGNLYGVHGIASTNGGVGVSGSCTGGIGVLGTVSDGYAVLGQAVTGNGVYGFSQRNHAIVGQTTRPFFGGVTGVATIANTVGIYGTTMGVASAYAGYMDGNFVVANGVKSAAVPHADGTHRLVYCMESPENWFEDFGEAKLAGGKAEVTLDADFAGIVHADQYHVFLTPRGDCKGLYVAAQSTTGFSVREMQGGAGTLGFSYRVVARRKDIAAKRLATFDLPGKVKQDVKPPQVPRPPAAPAVPQQP